MTMNGSFPRVAASKDEGFVLLDALVAVTLVAVVGTTMFAIGDGVLTSADRQLDRSAALARMRAISKEFLVLRSRDLRAFSVEDAAYTYELSEAAEQRASAGALAVLGITAKPKHSPGAPRAMSFLAVAAE
jgi:hypothetical protein